MDDLLEISRRHYIEEGTRKPDHYFKIYEDVLGPLRNEHIDILELGIFSGASVRIWYDFFPNANIVALDVSQDAVQTLSDFEDDDRVHAILGDQSDAGALAKCLSHTKSGVFDVIIDDASHIGSLSKASADYLLRNCLRSAGLYFVEDYGTGYIPDFPDGSELPRNAPSKGFFGRKDEKKQFKSHQYGMVGWLKQLVDEIHIPVFHGPETDALPIESIQFWSSIALIRKP